MRAACATEPIVKKKIRAVQYGVGPIGAAIVRLMWEKESIEIIGAIDSDPAKAGQDLGDVVGGPDAPWGVPVTDDAAAMLGESADVVIHSTSSLLPNVMDQLMACLAAESCVVSTCEELAYPFRKYPELAARLDAEAKTWGVALIGTGINPGFVMDKLLITLSAASQEIDSAPAPAEESGRGHERRGIPRAGRGGSDQTSRPARIGGHGVRRARPGRERNYGNDRASRRARTCEDPVS